MKGTHSQPLKLEKKGMLKEILKPVERKGKRKKEEKIGTNAGDVRSSCRSSYAPPRSCI